VGRAENQVGVSPAANWEAISLATAAELVRASATRELGRAVWSTPRMELLGMRVSGKSSASDRCVTIDVQVLSSDGGRKSGKGDELVLHVDGVWLLMRVN